VIDIILGDVLVVCARFLATAVVTLRCKVLSDMAVPPISAREANRLRGAMFSGPMCGGCGTNQLELSPLAVENDAALSGQ
jgi:hypothetical protein